MKVTKREFERFQRRLLKLKPIEFMGVAHILGIQLFRDEKEEEPFSFEEVYKKVLEKFKELSRRKRLNLDRILRAAIEKEDDSND